MSKKPPIKATCPAGCLWETVHKEDWENGTTFIEQYPDADGLYHLGEGIRIAPLKIYQYKIFGDPIITMKYEGNEIEREYQFEITKDDPYADYIIFSIILTKIQEDNNLEITYEVSGIRYVVKDIPLGDSLIKVEDLCVTGADRVLLYNDDATINLQADDLLANLPTGAECNLKTLVGTEEKPINLYTDLENGQLYNISGYVRYSASKNLSCSNVLVHKITTLQVLFLYANFNKNSGISNYEHFSSLVSLDQVNIGNVHIVKYLRDIISVNDSSVPISFYAPTQVGTAGQILQSKGSGAPTWTDPSTAGLATTADIEAAIGNVSALLGDTSDLEV